MKQKEIQKRRRRDARKRLFGQSRPVSTPAQEAKDQSNQRQEKMKLPIYYSDLVDQVPTEAQVDGFASEFLRKPTFFMVAMLNTFLSFFEKNNAAFTYIQGFLFTNLANDDLTARAKRRFGSEQMGTRPMFYRQQMLTLMKKVLLLGSDTGKYNPNDASIKDGKYALGEIALMTSDLLNLEGQAQRLQEILPSTEDWNRRYEELCTQMLPIYELTNPPDVVPALVRNREYFNIFERKAAHDQFLFSDGESLAARFLKLTGLHLTDYLLMVFAVYLNYLEKANRDGAVKNLIGNPGEFNIAIDVIFSKMRFSAEERKAFFQQTSISVEGLIEACRAIQTRFGLMQQYDFTAFRTYPLVYTREQQDLVTCIDSSFLAEKISTGVYYNIKQPLEQDVKKLKAEGDDAGSAIADKDHTEFLGHWGSAFEIYVNDRLRDTRCLGLQGFYASPQYVEPPSRSDTEVFDAALDFGETLVVFEHKGKYLELGAKYSGDREVFLTDLKSKKRIGKAVFQLADNLQWVFDNRPGATRRTFRDVEGKHKRVYGLDKINRVKRIYPVVVHQDFSLRLNGVNHILRRFFSEQLSQRTVDNDLVRPLTLLSVEDLETLLPYLESVRLSGILDDYAKYDDPLTTFEIIFNDFRGRRGIGYRRNEWIDCRSDEIWQEVRNLFVDLAD